MDYSNFIRTLYRNATTKLKEYRNYYGKIVNLKEPLSVPKEFLHTEESESMFLPAFSLNIDAPTNYFVDFMSYYIALMPDLGIVFANKERIEDLYNNIVNMNILEDDEKVLKYIELVVGVGIKTLEQQGILEK